MGRWFVRSGGCGSGRRGRRGDGGDGRGVDEGLGGDVEEDVGESYDGGGVVREMGQCGLEVR